MQEPLAERVRPQTLDEVIGQTNIVGKGKLLHAIVQNNQPVNLILWGPPGSGKTTLARIIAKELKADFTELSAVSAAKDDIRKVIAKAETNKEKGIPTILFVDEIHRFNKAQQDTFLPHLESGLLTLIGATTENPSFEVIRPLLSRSRVVVLQPHDEAELRAIIERAAKLEGIGKRLSEEAIQTLINLAGGDARVALGNLELAEKITKKEITQEVIESAAQQRIPNYDKNGEMHYDLISAFIKSMRAGDATATLYYLARMLQAGEDPKFIARRMIIFASEDIGLAGNGAMNLAVSCFLAIERIGLPEGEYTLYHCATTLAKAKKSRTIASAKFKAKELASEYPDAPVPLHLRNAPTKLMRDLNYQKGYRWEAGFHPQEGLLPDEIQGVSIFPSGE